LRLQLFGDFKLLDGANEEVKVPLRRARYLLAYLALKQTRTEDREVLIDLLWPDRFKEQAQASLRQVLFELRKLAPSPAPILVASRSEVALGAAVEECDVWAFDACAAAPTPDTAERMLQLHRAPFLDGPMVGAEPFQQWSAIQRTRLEGQLERAVMDATVDAYRGAAPGDRISTILEGLVRAVPVCCQAVMRLMEIATSNGQSAEAIRQYERYAQHLKLELGEAPPAELADAYVALKSAPNRPARFSPVRRNPAFVHEDPWRKNSNDAPVLAVLPFRHKGEDPAGDALAAALAEDITLMLSGCRWFSVLSRSATHSIKPDGPFVPSEFAHRTGTDYFIYGSISRRGDTWSATIELADAATGYIGWAKRYDAADANILTWGRDTCPLIVAAIDPAVAESERQAIRKPALSATASEVAYRHLILGYRHFYAGEWPDALVRFGSAIQEDATYAHAHAMLSATQYILAQVDRDERWNYLLNEAEVNARRALEIDPSEAKACNGLGQILAWQGRHDEALPYLTQALTLNPSFAQASTGRSYHALMIGAFSDAKKDLQNAMRLRVGDAGLGLCLPAKALADLHLGNGKEALETAHWAVRLRPAFWLGRQVLATCLWAEGNISAARETVAEIRRDYPGFTGAEFATCFPYANPEFSEPTREAFSNAGWA
jgi:DNA-binding SARP family transcriptional activator/Flp pilus assembly protein TadD